MRVQISEVRILIHSIFESFGFPSSAAKAVAENFIEAELSGKTSHGLSKVLWFKQALDKEQIKISSEEPVITKETTVSILVDGNQNTGFLVMNFALEQALRKVRQSGLVAVGLSNTTPTLGYIGAYAQKAVAQNLIFLAFNNSAGRVAPHGTKKALMGTNPITVGIPTGDLPFIFDAATSQITVGDVTKAMATETKLPAGVAINSNGEIELDPNVVWSEGALLPIAGHKGSGLGLVGELLAGVLTGSRAGSDVQGGWGTFFILIDPTLFRTMEEFTSDVQTFLKELKNLPKIDDATEILYPGESSQNIRRTNIENGYIEVDEEVWGKLTELTSGLQ